MQRHLRDDDSSERIAGLSGSAALARTGSALMCAAVAKLQKVARVDTTVLITGESGTGKEVAARFLHDNHPQRKDGPFVAVHCGAIPDSLIESELFGHVRGAFTGADRDRTGKFEQAHGGTLFLDEIATMKPEAQIRLLRVLQSRRVSPVGSSDSRAVDVRIVVASNQDLKALVTSGAFRLDLFYRVNTFPVHLPALRERRGDIPALAQAFADRTVERLGLPRPKRISDEALRALCDHSWPGNIRELENVVEHGCVVADEREQVAPEDLPPDVHASETQAGSGVVVTEDGVSFRTAVGNLEKELILQSLRLAEGNKARAAELLDLKRTTFLEKLKRLEDEGLMGIAQTDWSSARENEVSPA